MRFKKFTKLLCFETNYKQTKKIDLVTCNKTIAIAFLGKIIFLEEAKINLSIKVEYKNGQYFNLSNLISIMSNF